MRQLTTLLAAAVLAVGVALGAAAGPMTGTFTIDVYRGNGGGSIGAAGVQALATNPLITGTPYAVVTYTGDIDFFLGSGGTNTIAAFLNSGTGSYTATGGDLNVQLSAGGFAQTTVLDLYGTTAVGLTGTVTHDDGIGIYQGNVLVTAVAASAPTSPVGTSYSLAAGDFRIVYVAANGLPEQLSITATPVPEPMSMALLGAGLVGLAGLRRRRPA